MRAGEIKSLEGIPAPPKTWPFLPKNSVLFWISSGTSGLWMSGRGQTVVYKKVLKKTDN
jgi:hypothetical protein